MSAFSARFDWNAGLIWKIGVVSGAVMLDDIEAGAMYVCSALVDTGASRTCIARSIMDALGLQSIGKAGMGTAGGLTEVDMYDVHVALFVDGARNSDGSYDVQTRVFKDMRVSEFTADRDGLFHALIGRDILRIGVLTLSPDGHNSFAF